MSDPLGPNTACISFLARAKATARSGDRASPLDTIWQGQNGSFHIGPMHAQKVTGPIKEMGNALSDWDIIGLNVA